MINNSYREILQSLSSANSALEIIRQHQSAYDQLRRALEPTNHSALMVLAQQRLHEMSPAITAFREFEKSITANSQIYEQLNQATKIYSEHSAFSLAQNALKNIQSYNSLYDFFERERSIARSLELFNQAPPSLIDVIDRALISFNEGADEATSQNQDIIDAINSSLEEATNQIISTLKQEKSPLQTRLLIQFLIIFVWPVLLSHYYYSLGNKDTARIYQALSQIEKELDKSHEEIEKKIFYKVLRPVWITQEQNFQKNRILQLFPGQEVEVLDFDGKWVYVESLNLQDNNTYRGWVLKKYLKKIMPYQNPLLYDLDEI